MGILCRSRASNCTKPVKVIVTLEVTNLPKLIFGQFWGGVVDNVVVSGCTGPRSDILGTEVKIKIFTHYIISNNCASFRVEIIISYLFEKSVIDPFVDKHKNQLRFKLKIFDVFLHSLQFGFFDNFPLSLAYSIPENKNLSRIFSIFCFIGFQGVIHEVVGLINSFFSRILHQDSGILLSSTIVQSRHKSSAAFFIFQCLMENVNSYKHNMVIQKFRFL